MIARRVRYSSSGHRVRLHADARASGPAKFLEGYTGYLQADAYSVYDAFFKPERGMTEVGCWIPFVRRWRYPQQERRFAPYIEGLATAAGHEDRHILLKNYCKGLLLPGERKSIEPMAARLDPEKVQPMRQSLHHLVAKAPFSDDTLLDEVRNHVLSTMQKQGPQASSPYRGP